VDDTDRLRRLALQDARLSDDLSDEGGEAELDLPGLRPPVAPVQQPDRCGPPRL